MDNALQVGKKLVELCKQGKNLEAIETLYASNIVSIEPHGDEKMPARMEGIDAIKGKNKWFFDNHTIHGGDAKGPWANGDRFTVYFAHDVTAKTGPMAGKRIRMEETGLYTVKNGKVVQEEYFYDIGG